MNTDSSIIRLRLPCDSWADFYARFAKPLARSFFVAQELSGEAGAKVQVHVLLAGANLRLQGEGIARPATKGGRRGVAIQLQRLEGEGINLPLGTLDGEDDGESFFGDAVTQASTLPQELAAQLRRTLNLRVSPSVVPRRKLTAKATPGGMDAQDGDDPPGLEEEDEEEIEFDTIDSDSGPVVAATAAAEPVAAAPAAAAAPAVEAKGIFDLDGADTVDDSDPEAHSTAAPDEDDDQDEDEPRLLARPLDTLDGEDDDEEAEPAAASEERADKTVTAKTSARPAKQSKAMSGVTLIALGVLLGVVIGLIVGATLYLGSS